MHIELQPDGDLLELRVRGVLDNEVAGYLRGAIDDVISEGWHRIVVDMSEVGYLSSAGVSALLACRQQLQALHGFFGICEPAPQVRLVLEQTRLLKLLLCDRDAVRGSGGSGTITQLTRNRVASEHGVDLEFYDLDAAAELSCELFGAPEKLATGSYGADDCRTVSFPTTAFGLGLGAFGADFAQCRPRFGDFVAVAGGVAQFPTHAFGVPDYLLATEGFVPEVQLLYGVRCDGPFAQLIRFHASDASRPVGLSNVIRQCLSFSEYDTAGIVMLAECVGLVGAALRRSPALESVPAGGLFAFPEIRRRLSFSAEQSHRRSLAVIAGVARRSGADDELTPFLRPARRRGDIDVHLHAAAFPRQPLKKRTLDLKVTVHALFDSGAVQGVLHLLNDERPLAGAGETQMIEGGCWIAPITRVRTEGG